MRLSIGCVIRLEPIGSAAGISYLAINSQSRLSQLYNVAKCRRTSDSVTPTSVVEETKFLPVGAYSGMKFEITKVLMTAPLFWPSTMSWPCETGAFGAL